MKHFFLSWILKKKFLKILEKQGTNRKNSDLELKEIEKNWEFELKKSQKMSKKYLDFELKLNCLKK